MNGLVKKYPLVIYFLLSIVGMILLMGPQMIFIPQSLDYTLMFGQWGPAFAAAFILLLLNRKNDIPKLFSRIYPEKNTGKYLGIAIILPLVICFLSYFIISHIEYKQWIRPTYDRSFLNYLLCLVATSFSVTGEEIGWRGFMLPELMKKHSAFFSSIIVGFFWGIWHFRFQSLELAIFFIVLVIEYSIIISWLHIKTKGNLLVCIVFHIAVNMCSFILFEKYLLVLDPGTSIRLNTLLYGVFAILFAVPAIFISIDLIKKRHINI